MRATTPVSYRLGFAVKVVGEGGIPSADTRRWQSGPSLGRSTELLNVVFDYLARIEVSVYRLSSQVIPYGTHPDLPHFDFRRQLDEHAMALDALRDRAVGAGLRLSTHPGQYTVLNAPDAAIVDKAIADLEQDALLLDRLGQGREGTVVVHVGGGYGDRATALDRWEAAWSRLSDRARARLGLENDERLFGVEDVMELHQRTGVRVVLDVHHHRIHPGGRAVPLADALSVTSATWGEVRPKVHLSSARTMLDQAAPRNGKVSAVPPPLRAHADLVLPWDLETVIDAAGGPLDVMLEAKAKDVALLHLRRTVAELRPDLARAEQRGAAPAARTTSPADPHRPR